MRTDAELLNESLGLIAPRGGELVATFYDRLFEAAPTVRGLFPEDMTAQRERLLSAVIALVGNYHQRDELVPGLRALGERHVRYGAEPAHYDVVGSVLRATLREIAGEAWTDEYEGAWTRGYAFASSTMLEGAGATARMAAA